MRWLVIALVLVGCAAFSAPPAQALHSHRQPRHARSRTPCALTSPEIINGAVQLVTIAPQPFWLLMLAAPKSKLTKQLMGPIAPIIALSLAHLTIVTLAATAPGGTEPIKIFADVFSPDKSALDGMVRLFEVRDFVAEEWPHVLIWDLFVGRAIWQDALRRDINAAPALLFTNLIGPPGFLIYCLLSLLAGKGLPELSGEESAK